MLSENTVASAIANLRSDNITTSQLAFRSLVDDPEYRQRGSFSDACVCVFPRQASSFGFHVHEYWLGTSVHLVS